MAKAQVSDLDAVERMNRLRSDRPFIRGEPIQDEALSAIQRNCLKSELISEEMHHEVALRPHADRAGDRLTDGPHSDGLTPRPLPVSGAGSSSNPHRRRLRPARPIRD
jgi:hypothetical protein